MVCFPFSFGVVLCDCLAGRFFARGGGGGGADGYLEKCMLLESFFY